MDKVLSEEESRTMMLDGGGGDAGGAKGRKGGNYMKVLEERDRKLKSDCGSSVPSSVLNMSALSEGIEDLDKLNTSQVSCVQDKARKPVLSLSHIPNITNLPPPASSNSKKVLRSTINVPMTLSINKISQ